MVRRINGGAVAVAHFRQCALSVLLRGRRDSVAKLLLVVRLSFAADGSGRLCVCDTVFRCSRRVRRGICRSVQVDVLLRACVKCARLKIKKVSSKMNNASNESGRAMGQPTGSEKFLNHYLDSKACGERNKTPRPEQAKYDPTACDWTIAEYRIACELRELNKQVARLLERQK